MVILYKPKPKTKMRLENSTESKLYESENEDSPLPKCTMPKINNVQMFKPNLNLDEIRPKSVLDDAN